MAGELDYSSYGLDPEKLRQILAQMQASPEDKQQAKGLGLLGFGLSLAGAPRGQEINALGRAGLLGISTYRNELADLTKQRGQNLQQSLAVQDFLRRQSFGMGQVANGSTYGVAPQEGGPGGGDMGGPAPMPASMPIGQMPRTVVTGPVQDMRNVGMTEGEIAAVMSSRDPQAEYIKAMQHYRTPHFGAGKVPFVYGPGGGMRSILPEGADTNAAQVEGAITAAQEAAKARYSTMPVPVPGGTRTMPSDLALELLRGQQQRPAPIINGADQMTPETLARIRQDYESSGVGFTPGAIATHAANAGVDTTEQNKRGARNAQIQNSQTAYDDIFKQYRATREMAPHLANMDALEKAGVFSGPAGALGAQAANWINSVFPDANVKGDKLSNTQTYQSEIGKMQQAIARSFPGSQSDAELRALTSSLPSLMQTPVGRAQVRDILSRKIADAERSYDDASKYYKANGDLIGWKPQMFTPPAASFGGGGEAPPVTKHWVYNPKTRKNELQE